MVCSFFLFCFFPGHMVQQILDQNGTLEHVILSLDPMSQGASTGSESRQLLDFCQISTVELRL